MGSQGLLIMTQHLRVPALLCLVVLASTVSGQHGGLFGAPKKSNFEALLDKLPKVGRSNRKNGSLLPLSPQFSRSLAVSLMIVIAASRLVVDGLV